MISNAVGVLIFLSVFGIVASSPNRAIDCRKFVFAPICRGVAAKRGNFENEQIEPQFSVDDKSLQYPERYLYTGHKMAGDDEYRESTIEKTGNPIRKNKRERDFQPFYTLLSGSTKNNGERDNIPVEEYEYL